MVPRMFFAVLLLLPALLLSGGCAGHQVRGLSPEDTPEHHYLVGMNALEQGSLAQAQQRFERALYLDDEFSRAYAGLAVVCAGRAKGLSEGESREAEVEKAFRNLKKAARYAEEPEDELDLRAAGIRAHTLIKGDDWLEEAEEAYEDGKDLRLAEGRSYYHGSESLEYYMGIAYLEGVEFQKARERFAAVLSGKGDVKWQEKADRGWKKTDRIVRAMAGDTVGNVGKEIALKDSVSRGDLTALLVNETNLDRLFAGRIPASGSGASAEFTPVDVQGNPLRDAIATVLKWQVRGLEPKYDEGARAYLFKPADQVSRGELAFIMEDVLVKLTGDDRLASRYFGQERSPFPDVRSTSPVYNAVMNMTTRGIMEAELSGEFRPNDAVDGAEALLAVRVLKQRINIY